MTFADAKVEVEYGHRVSRRSWPPGRFVCLGWVLNCYSGASVPTVSCYRGGEVTALRSEDLLAVDWYVVRGQA